MINKSMLENYINESNINIADNTIGLIDSFTDSVIETNKVMNLTAITETDEVTLKHIIDSLCVLQYIDIVDGASVVDVGSGAGFPGVPLACSRQDLKISYLDSLQKRLNFIESWIEQSDLDVSNYTFLHYRAEDAGQNAEIRESFDYAIARAVASMGTLSEYCMPLVKIGGFFIAMKSNIEEINKSLESIKKLGGEVIDVISYELPNGDQRSIAIVKKVSNTPKQFPRKPKAIKNKPLE